MKKLIILIIFLASGTCFLGCSASRSLPGHSRMTRHEVRQADKGYSLYVRRDGHMIKRPSCLFPSR